MGTIGSYPAQTSVDGSDKFLMEDGSTNETKYAEFTDMKSQIANPIYFTNPYKFHVTRNAAALTGNNLYAVVAFDVEQFDTGGNVSAGVFTVPTTGFYQFNWLVSAILSTGADEPILATLFVNGIETSRGNLTRAMNDNGSAGSDLLSLTAGQTVDIRVFCTTARSLATGSIFSNYFSGYLVSKT